MTKTLHGKVHGKTIELEEDLGVAEGQEVEVQVKIVQPTRKWGRRHSSLGGRLGRVSGNGCDNGENPAGPETGATISIGG